MDDHFIFKDAVIASLFVVIDPFQLYRGKHGEVLHKGI
jgi:hypothetical protein